MKKPDEIIEFNNGLTLAVYYLPNGEFWELSIEGGFFKTLDDIEDFIESISKETIAKTTKYNFLSAYQRKFIKYELAMVP